MILGAILINTLFQDEYSEYDLFSMGADGDIGGEGNDSDIGNWEKND